MSQNRNNPRHPRYRRKKRYSKHFQSFLDRESARYLGQATQTAVTVVNTDFSFAATVSGSPGPYRIVGVPPTELRGVDQFYMRPFDSGGTDKAEVYGSNHDLGADRKITLASHALSVTITAASGTDTLTATHGMETGEGPFQLTTTGALPAGLSTGTDYYAIKVDASNFKPAVSVDATTSGTAVDFTDNGTGTHSLDRSFTIEQDMTGDGIMLYMARGINRETIKAGVATASGILEIFE